MTTDVLAAVIAAVLVVIAAVSGFDLVRRPSFRRLAFRNALRRKNEALLVVVGSLFGTAIVTSAFVVGDTLNSSIRDEARTRLGPIDEVVLVHHTSGLAEALAKVGTPPLPGVDGVMPMVTAPAAVSSLPTGNEQRYVEPDAFVHEIDFDAARRFGHRPADTGLVDAGPTPTGSEAVIGADLARQLHVGPGDQIVIFAFGQHHRFRVRALVPRVGIAGYHPTYAVEAQVVFVAPGTLDRMAAAVPAGAQLPEGRVLVSNTGGVFDSTNAASALNVHVRTAGLPGVEVVSEKQGTLDFAERQGSNFAELFGLTGGFIVIAGVLLLVNIFVMLAEERTHELGVLRALGLKRNHLVRTFGLEGNLYAITAAIAGSVAGIGVARVIVTVTERIFSEGDRGARLRFAVTPSSVAAGFAIGLAISLVTVWLTSMRIGRINVIRAIRNAPEVRRRFQPLWGLVVGGVGLLAGSQMFVSGAQDHEAVLALAGAAIGLWSAVPLLEPFVSWRLAVTLPCAVLLVFTAAAPSLLPETFDEAGVEAFFLQGVVLVATAVVLAVTNDDQFRWVVDRLSAAGRGVAARLGLANPLAKRVRTGLLLGMYALIVFVLVFMTVFASVFQAQAPQVAAETSAGYDLRVDSNAGNPVTREQLSAQRDVVAVAPLVQALAKFETPNSTDSFQRRFTGFDESLLSRGVPKLTSRAPTFASDDAAWRAVLASPALTIVPSDFLSGGNGPSTSTTKVGDHLVLVDPASGGRHDLTVAGVAGDLDPAENGAMVGARAVPTFVDRSVSNRFYVAVRDPARADAVATRLQADLLSNGVEADTFRSLVDDRLRGTTAFIRLLQGFLALGLVIGIAGLGVVMVRVVRERRREIGMLRAMGFRARTVRAAFLLEASFIAVQGIVIGAVLGLVTSYSVLSSSKTLGDRELAFHVPWLALGALAAATLGASLLAVLWPATQASRIRPAAALRLAD